VHNSVRFLLPHPQIYLVLPLVHLLLLILCFPLLYHRMAAAGAGEGFDALKSQDAKGRK